MRQLNFFRTITAVFLLLSCLFSISACNKGKSFDFLIAEYSAEISWEYGGNRYFAQLSVGEYTDSGRMIHMRMIAPESLAGITLTHGRDGSVLKYGELTLGEEMCARYLAVAKCAVPSGGLKYLSHTESGQQVYVDADGRWWYFDKESRTPSRVEHSSLKIRFHSFSCGGSGA